MPRLKGMLVGCIFNIISIFSFLFENGWILPIGRVSSHFSLNFFCEQADFLQQKKSLCVTRVGEEGRVREILDIFHMVIYKRPLIKDKQDSNF